MTEPPLVVDDVAAPSLRVSEPSAPDPAVAGSRPAVPRRRLVGFVLLTFGGLIVAFAVYLFALSGLQQNRDQVALQAEVRTDIANALAPVGGTVDEGEPVALLRIDAIGLEQAVVEGSDAIQLKKGPGHLRTSPLPGQAGNAVVLAHRRALGAPFARVGELDPGDEIVLTTGQGEQRFDVVDVRTVRADDASVFESDGADPVLTLVTSASMLSDDRLIVEATLDGEPVQAPGGQLLEVGQEELGARGTTEQLVTLVLWLQTLLIVAVATVLLYRRWRSWPAYLVTTPVLAAVLWLVFENLSLLLSPTL